MHRTSSGRLFGRSPTDGRRSRAASAQTAALTLTAILLLLSHVPGAGAQTTRRSPAHELMPYRQVLALTPGVEGQEFGALLDRLEARGLSFSVAAAGVGVLLREAPGIDATLRAEPGITRLLREPDAEAAATARAPVAAGFLHWWNQSFEPPPSRGEGPAFPSAPVCGGARRVELPEPPSRGERGCPDPPCPERVHYAIGRVVVNLIFPDGSAIGGMPYTTDTLNHAVSELTRALNWWNLKTGGAVYFVLVNHGTVPTTPIPEQAECFNIDYMVGCMEYFGFTNTELSLVLEEFNTAMKQTYGGHWSFIDILLNSYYFPGGEGIHGWAMLGGPCTVSLAGLGTFLDAVLAHEIGHIFQALDEYYGMCDCLDISGYLEVANNNCVHCPFPTEKCIMELHHYTEEEVEQMEAFVNPCWYTKGQIGVFDEDNDGILDIRETYPETEITTELPDTLFSSQNVAVVGISWDVAYPAPARYQPAVTINTIRRVEYSLDGRPWGQAAPADGMWGDLREEFELRLPELGGGTHTLDVRGVNDVDFTDRTPTRLPFFVYDVRLRSELEVVRARSFLVAKWQVDGRDFGSTYRLFRSCDDGAEELFAEIDSQEGLHDKFKVWDETVRPGHEYVYRLEVDIPGKGIKALGTAKQTAVLPLPTEGSFVTIAPNPFRDNVLFSVTVPKGPPPDTETPEPPPEEGNATPLPPGSLRSGLRDDGDEPLYWRDVRLAIYDVQGRLVRDLGVTRQQELSTFNRSWSGIRADGRPAIPGVYFLKIEVGETVESHKLVLVR
jgi:hypothetical protein